MKPFCLVGSVGNLTFSVIGVDRAAVDVDIFRTGENKPLIHKNFFTRSGAVEWANREMAKASWYKTTSKKRG